MTDTKQICEAIKGLPDNDRLQLHVRPVYKSDEWGMNRYLTTESDASIATDDLKALVAENARLKTEVVAANKGAQVNALVNESLAKKLKLAVEALEYIANLYAGDARRISMETLKQIRGKVKEEKYPCAKCGTLRTKSEGGTVFTVCDECWDKR